jgi:adenine-specific DNA-methyltransferase
MNIIKNILGQPYFQSKTCVIYNMDCILGMSKLCQGHKKRKQSEFDESDDEREIFKLNLTVTSPPYNISKEYETNMPLEEYIEWSKNWMKCIYDITDSNGSFWLNLGYFEVEKKGKAVPISYLLWDKSEFYMMQEVVWNYGAGVACKNYFSPRNEKFLWFVKDKTNYTFNLDDVRDPDVKYPNQKKNGKLRVNPLGKNPSDVWQIPKVTSGAGRASKERTPHPAQFPEAVIERVILASSNEGDWVLDPFMGSGTTAAVCARLNRKCLGFEINKDYCEIIANRLLKE